MELKHKLVVSLRDYMDMIEVRKLEMELLVGDMSEVEQLSVYQKLLDSRLEIDNLLRAISDSNLKNLQITRGSDGNDKIE